MSKEDTVSYKDLLANIACEIITGKAEDTYVNAVMEAGIETEPEARMDYEILFGTEIKQVGFIIPDEDHKYHDWIGISPDGLTVDNGMIEIKCPLAKTHFGYIESKLSYMLPSDYRYQVQGQLFVTGFDYCDFISYCKGMKLFVVRVYPDKDLFAEFEQKLDKAIDQIKVKIERYNKYNLLNE